jgi:hypothetical protein
VNYERTLKITHNANVGEKSPPQHATDLQSRPQKNPTPEATATPAIIVVGFLEKRRSSVQHCRDF